MIHRSKFLYSALSLFKSFPSKHGKYDDDIIGIQMHNHRKSWHFTKEIALTEMAV